MPSLSMDDTLNLGAVEIIVRGILKCEHLSESNLEHLKIARNRMSQVIISIEDSLEDKGVNDYDAN